MANFSIFSRLVGGVQRQVDLSTSGNVLVVDALTAASQIVIGATALTQTILGRLISLQNGSDVDATYHTHDGRYFTESEVGSSGASSGSDLVGDDNTYTNFTPAAATVKGALSGIDTALANSSDGKVKISSADTTRDFLDSSLTAGAGLSKSIVNPGANETLDLAVNVDGTTIEINTDALRLKSGGITNSHINATAAIDASKIADGSVSNAEFQRLDGVTSSIQTQLDAKALDSAVIKKDGSVAFTAAQSMGGFKLTNVATPTVASDAATKGYVDANVAAATSVELSYIAGATYKTVQDLQNTFHSTGWISGGVVTDATGGAIDVSAGSGTIRTSNSPTALLKFFDWAAATSLSLTNNAENFIRVNYNGGSPVVEASTTIQPNNHQYVELARVYRDGTTVHINSAVKQIVGDHAGLMAQFNKAVMPYAHESGSVITATGTRKFAVSVGAFWQGLSRFTTPAFDSNGADTFTYYYSDGSGGWTAQTAQTQISNLFYDDGSGTLATLGTGNYGVHWIYQGVDGEMSVLYGECNDATLLEAQDCMAPSALPPLLTTHSFLIGRIIIVKSASTFTEIASAFMDSFAAGAPANHNELSGLQGGTTNEYFHLTAAQHTVATQAATASLNGYLTSADWSTFNAKQPALGYTPVNKAGDSMTGALAMGTNKITGLGDPTAAQDAATKNYVDISLQGIKPKQAVRLATTANITLSGTQTIDGVSAVAGNRILVKDQTTTSENGIYVVAAGAWSRATDFDSLSPIDEINGSWVGVQEGTANVGHVFIQYALVSTLGSDPVLFTYFSDLSTLSGGDMIDITASVVKVDLATVSGLESSNPGNAAGQLRIKLEATTPSLKFTGSNELAAKLDAAGAIASGASGLAVQVDGSTIEISSNALRVKDAGIVAAKLAADSVITAKILDANVTTAKIANAAVDSDKLAASVAGAGLTGGAGSPLAVGAGDGITVAADSVAVSVSAIAGIGLEDDGSNNLRISSSAAGAGLTGGSGSSLAVGAGLGIQVNADSVEVLFAPKGVKAAVAGESMAANTSFLVRWALSGETAGRVYKADKDATTLNKFYAWGIALKTSAVSAGDSVDVIFEGSHTLGSSDSNFSGSDIGKPVYLTAAGAFSITPPSTVNEAVWRIGVVQDVDKIWVGGMQLNGIN